MKDLPHTRKFFAVVDIKREHVIITLQPRERDMLLPIIPTDDGLPTGFRRTAWWKNPETGVGAKVWHIGTVGPDEKPVGDSWQFLFNNAVERERIEKIAPSSHSPGMRTEVRWINEFQIEVGVWRCDGAKGTTTDGLDDLTFSELETIAVRMHLKDLPTDITSADYINFIRAAKLAKESPAATV